MSTTSHPGSLETWRKRWEIARANTPESIRRPHDDGYPYKGIPIGWFQVAWSSEIAPGDVRPMRYFAKDLVAWRDAAGKLSVMDAYCPHMGANLGYGGCVEGANIRCPYHGWLWNGSGENAGIPGTDRVNRSDRIKTWPVAEIGGLVLVWHHPDGAAPAWDLPTIPDLHGNRYDPYPSLTHLWANLPIRPQFVVENTVDVRHQQWVHGSPSDHDLVHWEVDGVRCRTRQELTFGQGKSKTWLTPDGPVKGYLDVEAYGVGLNIAHFIGTDDSVIVGAHTPVDEHMIDERTTVFAQREPGFEDSPSPNALKRFAFHVRQVELDIVVWENMRYVQNPPYTPDEAKIWREFRAWAKQFYETV